MYIARTPPTRSPPTTGSRLAAPNEAENPGAVLVGVGVHGLLRQQLGPGVRRRRSEAAPVPDPHRHHLFGVVRSNPEWRRWSPASSRSSATSACSTAAFAFTCDGHHKLLDVNSRVGANFGSAWDAAAWTSYGRCTWTSRVSRSRPTSRTRARVVVENYDLAAAVDSARVGELSLRRWLGSLRAVTEPAWFAHDDPAPFRAMCTRIREGHGSASGPGSRTLTDKVNGVPVRATKRGADRTPLSGEWDVVICGASFAGLAVARSLTGSGASVLVLDRYEIGERQTSACAAPTDLLHAMGLGDSVRQTFGTLVVHTPRLRGPLAAALHVLDVRLPAPVRAAVGAVRRRVRDRQGRGPARQHGDHRPR